MKNWFFEESDEEERGLVRLDGKWEKQEAEGEGEGEAEAEDGMKQAIKDVVLSSTRLRNFRPGDARVDWTMNRNY